MAKKRSKAEALKRLAESANRTGKATRGLPKRGKMIHDAAYLGAAGLIMLDPLNRLADERIVLPLDMVCIPAYQAFMINGSPSLQIYIRAGETIIPTGGNVQDVQQAMMSDEAMIEGHMATGISQHDTKKRKPNAYQKRYKANFKKIAPSYKLKNGKWKKNGFKAAVKRAHAMSKIRLMN